MVINLPPDIEQALTRQAHEQGATPELLALESLRREFVAPAAVETANDPPGTLADSLGSFIGVLQSGEYVPGGARVSENTGEKFTEVLIEKRRQGRA